LTFLLQRHVYSVGFFVGLMLSGCGHFSSPVKNNPLSAPTHWEGRLQVRVLLANPELFSANFELQGSPQRGELIIYSPIGTTLAVASWSEREALLKQGSIEKRFASMEELTMQLTGAQLPLQLLMSWLDTDGQSIKGWDIRSENAPAGRRIYAQRNQPSPPLQLTLLINTAP